MATEIVEYRPGKWMKVVEGRIVGRATADEVAAWQAGPNAAAPAALPALDIDLDLSHPPAADPGRTLDVPLRPAFERRRRRMEALSPGAAGRRELAPLEGEESRPPRRTLDMPPSSQPALRPPKPPVASPEERIDRPVLIRRRATPEPEPAATVQAQPDPSVEVPPLRKSKPGPPPTNRRPRAEAEAPPTAPQEPPVAAAIPATVGPEEAIAPSADQGSSYWWIWNAHRQPLDAFLREWAPRYRDKFGHEVTIVLCHEDDLAAVQACGFDADINPLLQPGHLYLGHRDGNGQEDRP